MSDDVYVVSTREAAAILQISPNKIYTLVQDGVLNTVPDGDRISILYDSMVDYLKQLEQEKLDKQFAAIRTQLYGEVEEELLRQAKRKHERELKRLNYHRRQQRRRKLAGSGPLGRIPGTAEKHSRKRTRYTGDLSPVYTSI